MLHNIELKIKKAGQAVVIIVTKNVIVDVVVAVFVVLAAGYSKLLSMFAVISMLYNIEPKIK